jgi:hypothetical protein
MEYSAPTAGLALLFTRENYGDPFGAALWAMWIARSDDGGAWPEQPYRPDAELFNDSGLFTTPIERVCSEKMTLPSEVVVGVENTRATSLSWPEATRRGFTDELTSRLGTGAEVTLTQETSLTMAQVLPWR